jgi:diacylglycerol kinase family enzyme
LKPRHVSVLLNGSSGTAEKESREKLRADLEAAFETHGITADVQFLHGEDLAAGAERALQSVARGTCHGVIAGGGDGTISAVASILAGSNVPLGVIPLGTLNHFAKDLHIPLSISGSVEVIAAGATRTVDVGEVNDRVFINNSSIGLYPYLVLDRERRRHRHGLPKWFAMVFAAFRALRYFPVRRLSIRMEGWSEACRSPAVFVGNNVYRITGPALGTRKSMSEGKLCLYVANPQSRIKLLWLACRCVFGTVDEQRDLRMVSVPAIEVDSRNRRLLVARDGEVETIRSPLRYKIRPNALRVFASASAA